MTRLLCIIVLSFTSALCFAEGKQDDVGIARQMSVTFSDLLWRYEPALIEKNLMSSVQNYRLQGVMLFDEGLQEYHAAWPSQQGVQYQKSNSPIKIPGSQPLRSIQQPILHDGRPLGELVLFLKPLEPAIVLNAQEQAFLNAHPVIKISNELDYPPYDFTIDGIPQGYNIDLIRLLAEKIGVKIEFVNAYTWDELLDLLKRNEIDLVHAVKITPDRSEYALFSDPYRRLKTYFVMQTASPEITDITQLYGKTFAVGKGWFQEEYLKENHPQINLLQVDNTLEMLEAVSSGKADATAGSGDVVRYIIKKHGLRDLEIGQWFKEMDNGQAYTHHFMANKTAPELISMVNKALALLSIDELDALERKWFGVSHVSSDSERTMRLGLSPEEQQFLNNLTQLSYCIDPDWMPYEQINAQGDHEGLTHDLISNLETQLGVSLVLVPTKTWSQSLEYIKQGRCSLLAAAGETAARLEYLEFTQPYNESSIVVAVRNEELFVENLASIQDKTLAVVENYAHKDLILERYPNLTIIEVNNVSDGLAKVRSGEVFGFVDTVPTIGYQMRREGIVDLKIGGKLEMSLALSIAVQKGAAPELLSILNKALNSLSDQEKQQLADKWFSIIQFEKVPDYTLLWQVLAGMAVLVLLILYHNRKLAGEARLSQELLLSTTRLDLALTSSEQGWWDWDVANSAAVVSDSYWKMVGYDPDEKHNANFRWEESIHPDDKDRVMQAVSDSVREDRFFDVSYRGSDRYGNPMWFRSMGKAIQRSENHQPIRMIGMIQNITQDKNRELEILRSREEAERANRAKSEFIANMSHEIRTPLNSVIGFSELLEQTDITPKQRGYLQSIRVSGKNLFDLINDILDLSKIEAGKMSVEKAPMNIRQLVSDIEQIFSFKVKEKALNFHVVIDDEVPDYLLLDEVRLRQVLFNLVGNAIKFTHAGEIEIVVNSELYDENTGESQLNIAIRDTGIGIPADQHEMVFGSFEQQQGQSNRQYGGTGLGLTISKKLVKLMGGEIQLQSTPGEGSTFTIQLAHVVVAESQPEEISRRASSARRVQFESAKVLVADDVESNRQLVKSTLEEHGLHIIEALDGHQAVTLCEELHPDLVMMDIRMPNSDGIEATQQIRQHSRLAHIPVVAMTAGSLDEEYLSLFQGFLNKPMTPTDIIVELQRHLAHRTAESADAQITQAPKLSNLDRETLIKILGKETLALCHNAIESGIFDDVKTFADALHAAGADHHIQPLCEYAESVLESVENFDVRKLRVLLSQFTDLIPDEEREYER